MKVSKEEFLALRKAINYLAFLDSDRATKKNCRGFNKIDSKVGHSLARKEKWFSKDVEKAIELVFRYRRQLPEDLLAKLPKSIKTKRKKYSKRKKEKNVPEFPTKKFFSSK